MNYNELQKAVANHAHNYVTEYPWLYASYEAFHLNRENQQYKFFSFFNMTCSDCAELYPQYMYESILKVATDDPEFSFKVRNTPFPMTTKMNSLKGGSDSANLVFF